MATTMVLTDSMTRRVGVKGAIAEAVPTGVRTPQAVRAPQTEKATEQDLTDLLTASNIQLMLERMQALQAENEKIKAKLAEGKATRKLSCKVSPKGALQVNGLGRFPVTLYASQWDFLLANIQVVKDSLEALRPQLAAKGDD